MKENKEERTNARRIPKKLFRSSGSSSRLLFLGVYRGHLILVLPERAFALFRCFLCWWFLVIFEKIKGRNKPDQDPKLLFFAFTKVGCHIGFSVGNTRTYYLT